MATLRLHAASTPGSGSNTSRAGFPFDPSLRTKNIQTSSHIIKSITKLQLRLDYSVANLVELQEESQPFFGSHFQVPLQTGLVSLDVASLIEAVATAQALAFPTTRVAPSFFLRHSVWRFTKSVHVQWTQFIKNTYCAPCVCHLVCHLVLVATSSVEYQCPASSLPKPSKS